MRQVLLIARAELGRLLYSPISLVFLGAFWGGSFWAFFHHAHFFSRNVADMHPLFDNIPPLLIGVVAVLSMRGWVEEHQRGQADLLCSLPVPNHHWVLGRFYGGLGLMLTALLGTLPLVWVASVSGDLDWGPVFSGYLGAALLGASTLALGLFISSLSSHHVVAMLGTAVAAGGLFYVGDDTLTQVATLSTAEWMREIGSGSRYASFSAGLMTLQDGLYFLSLTALFLGGNTLVLAAKPLDLDGLKGRRRALVLLAVGTLASLNVLLFLGWSQGIQGTQFDATETGEHSLHPATQAMLSKLDAPISIRGFFSDQTHGKVSRFVPALKDLLRRYATHSDGKVSLRFEDPSVESTVAQEIAEVYGLVSRPIRISAAHQSAIANTYFSVLIEQGSRHRLLSMEDLLVQHPTPLGPSVTLANVEYALTQSIRDLNRSSKPLEDVLKESPQRIRITLWQTAALVPSSLTGQQALFAQISRELVRSYPDQVTFEDRDFAPSEDLATELSEVYGLAPIATASAPDQPFYLHLLVDSGTGHHKVILPRSNQEPFEIRAKIEDSIRRSQSSYVTQLTLLTAPSSAQADRDYTVLERRLRAEFDVTVADPISFLLDEDTDIVLVAKPGPMSAASIQSLQRFLGRGGTLIALYGAHRVTLGPSGLMSTPSAPSFAQFLAQWGLSVQNRTFLADDRNARFAMPLIDRTTDTLRQWVEEMAYPLFPEVRSEHAVIDRVPLQGLAPVTVPWASRVLWDPTQAPAIQREVWLRSSAATWEQSADQLLPDFAKNGPSGFPIGDPVGQLALLGLMTGRFTAGGSANGQLFLIPSSDFASDFVLALSDQTHGESHSGNVQLLLNLIDWSTGNTSRIPLRQGGLYSRKLDPMSTPDKERLEKWAWLSGLCFLSCLVVLPRWRRNRLPPIGGSS